MAQRTAMIFASGRKRNVSSDNTLHVTVKNETCAEKDICDEWRGALQPTARRQYSQFSWIAMLHAEYEVSLRINHYIVIWSKMDI